MNPSLSYRRICLLPPALRNQIAAGEVVERPASVLKELLENSLDAGATHIVATLEDGGQSLLAVRDNGHGLPAPDLELAVTRHATSKLVDFAELLTVSSYGFRGEALPSIASVADLLLESAFAGESAPEARAAASVQERTPGVPGAAFIRVRHGEVVDSGPSSLPEGTLVSVRNLFANVPARLKFLKSPSTELKRCQEVFIRLALARRDVSFSLNVSASSGKNRELLTFPAGLSLAERLLRIWPGQGADDLIPFDGEAHGVRAHGLASLPRFAQHRGDRQLLYVNNRPVTDKVLLRALREAYKGRLTSREYPQVLLFLELAPHEVDVNVHPAKSEVRFRDERAVFSAVLRSLGRAIAEHDPVLFQSGGAGDEHVPQDSLPPHRQNELFGKGANGEGLPRPEARPAGFWGALDHPRLVERPAQAVRAFPEAEMPFPELSGPSFSGRLNEVREEHGDYLPGQFPERQLSPPPLQEPHPDVFLSSLSSGASSGDGYPVRVGTLLCLGQMADTYLIVLQDDTLLLLDQHAVHERVLVNELMRQSQTSQSQLLALPEKLFLHPAELPRLREVLARLTRLGYSLELDGQELTLGGVPPLLGREQGLALLRDILTDRVEGMDALLTLMACKSAIKAGQKLTGDEAAGLISRWLDTPDRSFCPHGRPAVISFTSGELEKLFKRKIG